MAIDPTIALQIRQPDSPLETFTRLAQLKMMGKQSDLADRELKLRDTQQQEAEMKLRDLTQQYQENQALRKSYADVVKTDANGHTVLDKEKLFSNMQANGIGHLVPDMQTHFAMQGKTVAEQKDAELKLTKTQSDMIGAAAGAVLNAPPEQRQMVYRQAIEDLQRKGLSMDGAPPEYDESYVTQAHLSAISASDQANQELRAREMAQAKELKEKELGQAKELKEKDLAQEKDLRLRGLALTKRGQDLQLEGMELTPQALDNAATYYHTSGQMPALGMGKAAAASRSKIMNREAELFGASSIATNRAVYEADKKSLQTTTSQLDAVNSFESTAKKNLQQFLDLAKKVPDTGSPWLTMPVRLVSEKAIGNDQIPAYNAARQVAINEIAKITTDPNMKGVLSDHAREEVSNFSPQNATFKQIRNVADVLLKDMENRKTSIGDQQKTIQERMKMNERLNVPITNQTGTVQVTAPDGSIHTFLDQASADAFKKVAGIK